jgi:hypothetical protein
VGKLGDREGSRELLCNGCAMNFALSDLGKIRKEFVFLGKGMVRPGGFELPTFWFGHVGSTNGTRGFGAKSLAVPPHRPGLPPGRADTHADDSPSTTPSRIASPAAVSEYRPMEPGLFIVLEGKPILAASTEPMRASDILGMHR